MASSSTAAAPRAENYSELLQIDVFHINGQPLVTGLLWETLERPRNYMAEARKRGKEYGMDIVAIRETPTVTQAGFAPRNRGAFKGMYSFAHVMADVLGDNCLAVFALPDGKYALFAVLDGGIVPGSDVVGTREEIEAKQNAFRNMVEGTAHQWKRLIAPAGFVLADETIDLSDVITTRTLKRQHQLKQLTFGLTQKEMIRIGAMGAALIGVVGTGTFFYKQHEAALLAAQQLKQQQDAIAAAKALAAKSVQAQQVKEAAHPWATVMPVDVMIAECMKHLDNPPSLGGWVLQSAECHADGTFGAMYARTDYATVQDFEDAVAAYFHAPALILDGADGGGVGGRFPVSGLANETLDPEITARNNFYAHFQAKGLTTGFQLVPAPTPTAAEKDAPVITWKTYHFDFVIVDETPAQVLANLPRKGLRITEIALIQSGGAKQSAKPSQQVAAAGQSTGGWGQYWEITGDLYAQ